MSEQDKSALRHEIANQLTTISPVRSTVSILFGFNGAALKDAREIRNRKRLPAW